MCARPRQTSDEQILQATARAIGRVGPAKLTLADVADELDIAPATLVQRFGSKRKLLLALASQGASSSSSSESSDMCIGDGDATVSPLTKIDAYVSGMATMARTPQELANHLLFLHTDLTDPEFHRLALAHATGVLKELTALLDAALKRGELAPRTNTAHLARAIQSMLGGSLMAWAILRKGPALRQLKEDYEMLIEPYRRRSANRPSRKT